MKRMMVSVLVVSLPLILLVCSSISNASIVEFGITSMVGGTPIEDPWAFEVGYSGAWILGGRFGWGMGQTFKVNSDRELLNVHLRVGGFGGTVATGQFEVAVYEYDDVNSTVMVKIAHVTVDASDYDYDFETNVPISAFDLSSFHAILESSKTYAIEVTCTWSLNGIFTLQGAQQDLYPEGSAYIIPEPLPPVLLALEIVGPEVVYTNSDAQYQAIVHYGDNSTKDVTELAEWSVEPDDFASIDVNGHLYTGEIGGAEEEVIVRAEYTEDVNSVNDVKIVTIFEVGPGEGVLLLDAIDRGCYGAWDSGRHNFNGTLLAYPAGEVDNYDALSFYRNFFVFYLPNVSGTIISAQLRLDGGATAFVSNAETLTYTLFDVTVDIEDLMSGAGSYSDLGTGIIYGSEQVSADANNGIVTVNLNDNGLAYLNSTEGLVAMGGWITTLGHSVNGDEWVFGNTDENNNTKLVFTLSDGIDFIDYAYFANHWEKTHFAEVNNCNWFDLDYSNNIDANDLKILFDFWMGAK